MTDANHAGHSKKMRGVSVLSTTYYKMSQSYGNHRKGYVEHPKDTSKLNCLIHGPGNSSVKSKVLGDFGSKYTKDRPTKHQRKYPVTKKRFGIQQKSNDIIQHSFDEIILQEKENLSVKYQTQENIDDEVD